MVNSNLQNFIQDISSIDFFDGNLSNVESALSQALVSIQTISEYKPLPIAPFSEPANLNNLVGDLWNQSYQTLYTKAGLLDQLYTNTAITNNLLNSSIQDITANLVSLNNKLNTSINPTKTSTTYYYVTESFTSLNNINQSLTTGLVDTDFGIASLTPTSTQNVTNFDFSVDTSQTNGIPGCNLLVLDLQAVGTTTSDPQPVLSTENTKDIGNMFDGDSTTKLEVERNIIYQLQPLSTVSYNSNVSSTSERSFYYKQDGLVQDVIQVTDDYDWQVVVQWPNSTSTNSGDTVPVADFVTLDSNGNIPSNFDPSVQFVFNLKFTVPTSFSTITLSPYSRDASQPIIAESIIAQTSDNQYYTIADTLQLTNQKTYTTLQQDINKNIGNSTVGVVLYNPTNKPVSNINFKFKCLGAPAQLAHPFNAVNYQEQSTRHTLFISSTDTWSQWGRTPVNTTPPQLVSQLATPNLLGSVSTSNLNSLASILSTSNSNKSTSNLLNTLTQLAGISQINQTTASLNNLANAFSANSSSSQSSNQTVSNVSTALGKAGGLLSQVSAVIGAVQTVSQLVQSAFSFNHSQTVLNSDAGYDIFSGLRASVGFSDMSINQDVYSGSQSIVSGRRTFDEPVSTVYLYSVENVPTSWSSGSWINYSISVDGTNWLPIMKTTGASWSNGVNLATPSANIYFKVDLTFNQSDTLHSPAVDHITLIGKP